MWKIILAILTLIFFAVLELGKHTVIGWILTAAVLCAFIFLRIKLPDGAGRGLRSLAWIGLPAVFAVILWISRPPVKPVPALERTSGVTGTVRVAQGDLTGVISEDGEIEVYAGIPYAKPPIGELRWREPEPADPWEGVLAADHFGPMAMQTRNLPIYYSLAQIIGYHDYKWFSFTDNYREPVSEDSLYLNIWKPAGDVKDLPVLVYIHGGSLQTGQPWYNDYSGQGPARGGIVVVEMAYRLGIFGFFADEELAAESPNGTTGNYGLLDQILALQWVQENIAAFGGDPGNVTISGESAGSACVTALCTSPLAKGLFRRAVGESSTTTAPEPAHSFRLMDEALETGAKTRERYGASSIADMRQLPAEKIVGEMNAHHHITVDGYVLTETPYESYRKGIHNEEAILQGFNRGESGPFILLGQADLKNYEEKVRRAFEIPYADRVLELFPASTDEEARANWADIYTAVLFSYGHYCWERQALANGIPVRSYYFTKENGRLGSWHSGELVYMYGNIPEGSKLYDETDRALSRAMQAYLINFVTDGDPNGEDLPEWPESTAAGSALELGEQIRMTEAPYLELYKILDEMYGF